MSIFWTPSISEPELSPAEALDQMLNRHSTITRLWDILTRWRNSQEQDTITLEDKIRGATTIVEVQRIKLPENHPLRSLRTEKMDEIIASL